jgi:hypothetical protein
MNDKGRCRLHQMSRRDAVLASALEGASSEPPATGRELSARPVAEFWRELLTHAPAFEEIKPARPRPSFFARWTESAGSDF